MTGSSEDLPVRRYSDEEVRAILRRATEVDASPALREPGHGLTLDELQEVAREAGIDPEAVRRAGLAALPSPSASAGGRLFGGPSRRRHRVFLPGRLPERRRAEVTDALERTLDREMTAEVLEDGVRWEEDHGQGRTRVTLRESEGGTELEVDADRKGWFTLLGVGAGVLGASLAPLLAGFMTGLPAWPLLVSGAAVALVLAGIRAVWAPYSRRLHRTLEDVVSEVVARVETPALEPGAGDGRLPPASGDASPGA